MKAAEAAAAEQARLRAEAEAAAAAATAAGDVEAEAVAKAAMEAAALAEAKVIAAAAAAAEVAAAAAADAQASVEAKAAADAEAAKQAEADAARAAKLAAAKAKAVEAKAAAEAKKAAAVVEGAAAGLAAAGESPGTVRSNAIKQQRLDTVVESIKVGATGGGFPTEVFCRLVAFFTKFLADTVSCHCRFLRGWCPSWRPIWRVPARSSRSLLGCSCKNLPYRPKLSSCSSTAAGVRTASQTFSGPSRAVLQSQSCRRRMVPAIC